MKIRISREQLTSELAKLQGVVSQRSTLAILSNALFHAADGRLKLDATDLDISVSTACPCEVLEEGSVTLQAKAIFDIVKSLEDDEIEIETEDNYWAQLRAGAVNCRIVGTHPDDFPQVPDTSDVRMYPIATERLLTMIEKTLFSVSTDDARPNLTGAFFRITEENSLLMVSTDGHRLSKIEVKPEEFDAGSDIPSQLRDGIIIPRKGLAELKRNVSSKGAELAFGISGNNVVFKQGPMTLSVRLINGSFPNLSQVLPQESENKAFISRDVFNNSLRFVSLFANPKTNNVRLSLTDDGLELYASDPDRGEGKKLVQVEYSGPSVKAGYNYKYLIDVLSALDGDDVALEIIDTLSPTLIRDAGNDEALFIVMPMRL